MLSCGDWLVKWVDVVVGMSSWYVLVVGGSCFCRTRANRRKGVVVVVDVIVAQVVVVGEVRVGGWWSMVVVW